MTSVRSSDVLEALEGQAACYRELAELADAQHRHVRTEGAEGERALLEVLGQRQTVMDRVASFEPVLAEVRRDWPSFADTLSTDDRTRAEALHAEVRELLTRITDGDRDDTLMLQQRKLTAGDALRATKVKTTAGRHYAGAAYAKQRSVDFKG
ncbi:MAG: hypothetical protein AAF656_08635 [Planctomycetota bacterium]